MSEKEEYIPSFCGMSELILEQKRKIKELTVQLQTDDSCSKCKHVYLVKQDNGYFIAKCRKGHNECSKEDIRFCEDFELSGVLLQ